MIIWIASYPKSGNTWVRSLLSSYLFSDDGSFNFKLLKNINQFPSEKYLKFFLKKFDNIKEVSNYWIAAQERINLFNEDYIFLKTHSALCKLENNLFTNKKNTKAVIYIVRDPRNVVTSISNHFEKNLIDSFDFIKSKENMLAEYGSRTFGIATVIGSWSNHYNSWKNINFAPIIIIRYEDLIHDTKKTFKKILIFLSKIIALEINDEKLNNTIKNCTFDNLKRKEKIEGFDESIISKKNKKKIKFFNLGSKNNWRELLDSNIEKKIREIFFKEMKELNYID